MENNNILGKIFTTLVIIAIIMGMNLIVNMINLSRTTPVSNNNNNSNQTNTTENYDVSDFDSLNLSQVLELFSSKDTSILYLGRSSCSACVSFLPTLKKVQNDLGFKTKYLDITTVDTSSNQYLEFMNKLTKKIEVTVNGEATEGKISEYYGYTPMVIVIKDKKVVDAFVGAYSETKYKNFLKDNGIK